MQCLPRYPRLIASLRMFYLLAGEKKESTIYDFLDQGYELAEYRRVHANPMFKVNTPVWSQLGTDDLLPPLPVEGQAGPPKMGPRKKKRIPSRGEFNSSSKFSTPLSALGDSSAPLP